MITLFSTLWQADTSPMLSPQAFLDNYSKYPMFSTSDGRKSQDQLDEFDDARQVLPEHDTDPAQYTRCRIASLIPLFDIQTRAITSPAKVIHSSACLTNLHAMPSAELTSEFEHAGRLSPVSRVRGVRALGLRASSAMLERLYRLCTAAYMHFLNSYGIPWLFRARTAVQCMSEVTVSITDRASAGD